MAGGLSIRGLQEAQKANLQMVQAMRMGGAFGEAIRAATVEAHRYAVQISHVDTGAYKAAQRMAIFANLRGQVFIDPGATNPRRGNSRPAIYGFFEQMRGGSHATYERVQNERGNAIGMAARTALLRGMP